MLTLKHLRHPATIISAVALFVVAFGGGAAAYASGLIPGSKIENHSIPAKKLTAAAIKSLHGARGARGPAGPSHSYQNLGQGNLDIGVDDTHPATLTALTLPGSATYLVSASGSFFPSSGIASDDCDGSIQLDLDSFPGKFGGLTYNEVSASMDASGNYLNGMYSLTQLVTLPAGSHTLRVDAFMFQGTTICTSYGNALTATLVGTATNQAARSNVKAPTQVGPPR